MRMAMRILGPLLLFAAAVAGSSSAHPGNEKYDGGVLFYTEGGPPEGPCLSIAGRLTASEFFAHLEKRNLPAGVEFRRNERAVTHFPAEVSVRLSIQEFPCHLGLLEESPLKLTLEDMRSLRFVAYWKRGMHMRPAGNLALRTAYEEKVRLPPPDFRQGKPRRESESRWIYEFALTSANVPLRDHLVLVILRKDGRRLARVSARL